MATSFISRYHGKSIRDDGSVTSDEFKSFVRSFRAYARKVGELNNANLVLFYSGHYDVGGFFEKMENGYLRYAYFSYNVPRGERPMDFDAKDCLNGLLVRSAKGPKDFTGGRNNFTSVREFSSLLGAVLDRGW